MDAIPQSHTLVHNDLHPGNIMVQDGELLLIDMPDLILAPPVLDLTSIFRDMISGATSPDPRIQAQVEESVGMPVDLITKVASMFFAKYTGIADPEELQACLQRIGLLYAFNVVFMVVSGSESGRTFAESILDNALRKVVIPNAETIKVLFQTM